MPDGRGLACGTAGGRFSISNLQFDAFNNMTLTSFIVLKAHRGGLDPRSNKPAAMYPVNPLFVNSTCAKMSWDGELLAYAMGHDWS